MLVSATCALPQSIGEPLLLLWRVVRLFGRIESDTDTASAFSANLTPDGVFRVAGFASRGFTMSLRRSSMGPLVYNGLVSSYAFILFSSLLFATNIISVSPDRIMMIR
jgi:hypothetical protein